MAHRSGCSWGWFGGWAPEHVEEVADVVEVDHGELRLLRQLLLEGQQPGVGFDERAEGRPGRVDLVAVDGVDQAAFLERPLQSRRSAAVFRAARKEDHAGDEGKRCPAGPAQLTHLSDPPERADRVGRP